MWTMLQYRPQAFNLTALWVDYSTGTPFKLNTEAILMHENVMGKSGHFNQAILHY